MNKRRSQSAIQAALLALLLVRVPFDFRAGEMRFAPGEYVVTTDGASAGSVTIRSRHDGRTAAFGVRKAAESGHAASPTVSFRAYGESRFLSAIELDGERWDIPASAGESALARTHGQPTVTSLKAEAFEKK